MSNALDNAAKIDAIVDAIESVVASVLGIGVEDVLETQESDEVPATRGYVTCEAQNVQPLGPCNYQVPLSITIGFQVPDDGRKRRVQRLEWQMAMIQALTAGGAVPNLSLVVPVDFAVTNAGSEPYRFVWGGMTLVGAMQIVRG